MIEENKNYGKTKEGKDRKRPPRKGEGRPSTYNEEIGDLICKGLTEGRSLKRMTEEDENIPAMSTIFEWIWGNPEFSEKYTKARQVQAEGFVDEIMDISDKGGVFHYDQDGNKKIDPASIQRARLMVDTRKWYASKIIPKIYGDQAKNMLSVTVDNKDVDVPARVTKTEWLEEKE